MADSVANYVGAGVTFVVSIIASIVAYVRASTRADVRIDRMQKDIDEIKSDVSDLRDAIKSDLGDMRTAFKKCIDGMTSQFGESLIAFRQKITDVELWNRDNFVKRTDFQNAIDSFTRSIDGLRSDMNAGYLRLDTKLDRIMHEDSGK